VSDVEPSGDCVTIPLYGGQVTFTDLPTHSGGEVTLHVAGKDYTVRFEAGESTESIRDKLLDALRDVPP
jgi:hypothetical protein